MNSRLYIPALITLGLGLLSGCGGSSSNEQAYLPTGLQRTLDITLPETTSNLDAFVVLYNPQNISKGLGSATCSVRDAEYTETETQQDNCQAVIRDFRVPPSSDQ